MCEIDCLDEYGRVVLCCVVLLMLMFGQNSSMEKIEHVKNGPRIWGLSESPAVKRCVTLHNNLISELTW